MVKTGISKRVMTSQNWVLEGQGEVGSIPTFFRTWRAVSQVRLSIVCEEDEAPTQTALFYKFSQKSLGPLGPGVREG